MDSEKKKQMILSHRGFFQLACMVYNRLLWRNKLHARGVQLSQGLNLLKGLKIYSSGVDNRIILGDFVRMKNCTIRILGSHNTITIGEHSTLNQTDLHLENDRNQVIIGRHTDLYGPTSAAVIEGTTLKIGDDCMFSGDLHIRTGDSHSVVNMEGKRINPSKDIVIGDHVWIGTKVTCLKGVHVPENCIVAATTTLCGRYDQKNAVIAGVPGKIVKTGVNWSPERLDAGQEPQKRS